MKPLKLVLDYTNEVKAWPDIYGYETSLTLWYPNGEHACTFPERRDCKAGRRAAKTFMKYADCVFTDKTKE